MRGKTAHDFSHRATVNTDFLLNLHVVVLSSILNEREIEEVSVESYEDKRLGLPDVLEELNQKTALICFVENSESADNILWLSFGLVVKITHILIYHFSVGNQVPLAVDDIGDHHNLVSG